MRPVKDFSFKRNGDSLAIYVFGKYCGCYSIKKLCENAEEKRNKSKGGVSAKPGHEWVNTEKGLNSKVSGNGRGGAAP